MAYASDEEGPGLEGGGMSKEISWSERFSRRQDTSNIDVQKLVNKLLTQLWQHECQIITNYMPKYPRPDTTVSCVIRHTVNEGNQFLRYSNGPLQGFFWDVYGDDFHTPELALIALSQAPTPSGAVYGSTHGK
jgi:hypothetical protein